MPTYSYQCKRCSHIQDIFHAMSAKPAVKCEECGGSCIKLLGTGAGIIFKGSGFYETDYKKKGKPSSSETGASKNETKTASDKSATDKSAAKTEKKAASSAKTE